MLSRDSLLRDVLQAKCYQAADRRDIGVGFNGTVARYAMDSAEDRLYPNVIYNALIEAADFAASPLSADDDSGTVALQDQLMRQLNRYATAALQAQQIMLRQLYADQQSLEAQGLHAEAQAVETTLARIRLLYMLQVRRFPQLALRVPVLDDAAALGLPPLMRGSAATQTYDAEPESVLRHNLLARIQSVCNEIGKFRIVKGTNDVGSRVREQFNSKQHWHHACYRLDRTPSKDRDNDPELVVDELATNVDVLTGEGRFVTLDPAVYQTPLEFVELMKQLFLAFPGCFTFQRFDSSVNEPFEQYVRRLPGNSDSRAPVGDRRVFVSLPLPVLVARTNQVLPAGVYRLDRTNFLTLSSNQRTVAVRSAFRERDGRLRFAEYVLDRPRFEASWREQHEPQNVAAVHYAGNANLFVAVPSTTSGERPRLLAFWVGLLGSSMSLLSPSTATVHNIMQRSSDDSAADDVCHIRTFFDVRTKIEVSDEQAPIFDADGNEIVPQHNIVAVRNRFAENADNDEEAATGTISRALFTDFLCAAQPGAQSCHQSNRNAKVSPLDPRPSVAFLLLTYVLAYYSKYRPEAVFLYTRMWRPKEDRRRDPLLFASGHVAQFYNRALGLQFVPFRYIAEESATPMATAADVAAAIRREIGLDYLLQRPSPYADLTCEQWLRGPSGVTWQQLREHDSDFCNLLLMLLDARAPPSDVVDLERLTQSPLLRSRYYQQYLTVDMEREYRSADNRASDGMMFRFYPHIAELHERLEQEYARKAPESTMRSARSSVAGLPSQRNGIAALDDDVRQSVAHIESPAERQYEQQRALERIVAAPGNRNASAPSPYPDELVDELASLRLNNDTGAGGRGGTTPQRAEIGREAKRRRTQLPAKQSTAATYETTLAESATRRMVSDRFERNARLTKRRSE